MSDLDPSAMTRRDLEVLTLLTWGRTNREIADQFCVSLTTATTYIRYAYRKAGVTRRTQAVVWGFKHGLATTDWSCTGWDEAGWDKAGWDIAESDQADWALTALPSG